MLSVDIDWISELDVLRKRRSLNDTGLAGELGMSRSMLSQVRMGHRPLPTKTKLLLLNKLDYPLTRGTVIACLSDELKNAIASCVETSANAAAREKCFEFLDTGFDCLKSAKRNEFFELLCRLGGCDLATLASLLQLDEADLLQIQQGKGTLNFLAKTAIFECFDQGELANGLERVGSNVAGL